MGKPWRNFGTDVVLFLQAASLAGTGIILELVLPPGSCHHRPQPSFLGLGRHDWGAVHFWVALSLVAVLVLHLVLHWSWIVRRLAQLVGGGDRGRRTEGE